VRILILATAYNGLCQRVHRELDLAGHQLTFELSKDPKVMLKTFSDYWPELVICPFLKHRIPDSIWQQVPCLVLHPGIAGDRGPSSLDWAIVNRAKEWGATLLQANHTFDAGAIWATSLFKTKTSSKAHIYRHNITKDAAKMIVDSVAKYSRKNKIPFNIKLKSAFTKNTQWRPFMKQEQRKIDWQKDSSATIIDKINAADSDPGVLDEINGKEVYLFGAQFEQMDTSNEAAGALLGHRDEAICRATKDGAVWIKQLKLAPTKSKSFYKLPAMRVLNSQIKANKKLPILNSDVQNDISVEIKGKVAYLHFDFYNGAFNSEQCKLLLNQFLITSTDPKIKVVVLMGGDDFWSNGIHLNCIEHAKDPARESWRNINAINDLVKAIIDSESVLTVAALRNNAGAGGAIVPLACDYVIGRKGVVLNPHYQVMGLTGSEYWSYLLPKRVGKQKALQIMHDCLPLLTQEAEEINLVDLVFDEDMDRYQQQLENYCQKLASSKSYKSSLNHKMIARRDEEKQKGLSVYRNQELKLMRDIFNNPKSSYHQLRYNFVHKIDCGKTPKRLIFQENLASKRQVKMG